MIDFKIATSYFYQVRFFRKDMLPVSTAVYDPKWYHDFKGQSHVFQDKNDVLNGFRFDMFVPGEQCAGLCSGPTNPMHGCSGNPDSCLFLSTYYKQLQALDFNKVMSRLSDFVLNTSEYLNLECDPTVVFLFHEAPDKLCSERKSVQRLFAEHNIVCNELHYPIAAR